MAESFDRWDIWRCLGFIKVVTSASPGNEFAVYAMASKVTPGMFKDLQTLAIAQHFVEIKYCHCLNHKTVKSLGMYSVCIMRGCAWIGLHSWSTFLQMCFISKAITTLSLSRFRGPEEPIKTLGRCGMSSRKFTHGTKAFGIETSFQSAV